MKKDKKKVAKPEAPKTPEGSYYHSTPRNELEKMVHELIPRIANVYGIEKTNFMYDTLPATAIMCGEDNPEERGDGAIMFSINYRKIYRTAYICIHPLAVKLFKKGELNTIKHGLVHELAHLLTEELAETASSRYITKRELRDQVEQTTESIAMIARTLLSKIDPVTFQFK